MGSLKVAWYAGIHPLGAGASTGGPVGSGSASFVNISSDLSVNAQRNSTGSRAYHFKFLCNF